ncbi:uncharacterized protein [Aegilops tauschii subsp. strangulata]|uniref:uncharacterized protein n=1 Tax=Aegilops tauschii subsp. strangulata TaxID=200361 RepID=UPI00098BBB2A|nr:uncharacterized protein LOC109734759 [Aegilops tauschii subsp. strangulata]
MASTAEIYSLPDTLSNLVGSCSDQELISRLREYGARAQCRAWERAWEAMDISKLFKHTRYLVRHGSEAMDDVWKTDHGTWSSKKLVSIPNTSQGNSPNSPRFVGTKTTMEFKPADGSKAVVSMTRYNLLTTRDDGDGLDLDEDLALCHVFPLEGKGKGTRNRNGKRPRSGHAVDPREPITRDGLEELDQMMSNSKKYPIPDVDMDVHLLLANQPSKHWQNFTKIHTKNPKLMYAACNHCDCDTVLKLTGGPSCGTGSLKHHNDSCRCKPKQEQLPGSSSSTPIPSIALQAIAEQL